MSDMLKHAFNEEPWGCMAAVNEVVQTRRRGGLTGWLRSTLERLGLPLNWRSYELTDAEEVYANMATACWVRRDGVLGRMQLAIDAAADPRELLEHLQDEAIRELSEECFCHLRGDVSMAHDCIADDEGVIPLRTFDGVMVSYRAGVGPVVTILATMDVREQRKRTHEQD